MRAADQMQHFKITLVYVMRKVTVGSLSHTLLFIIILDELSRSISVFKPQSAPLLLHYFLDVGMHFLLSFVLLSFHFFLIYLFYILLILK